MSLDPRPRIPMKELSLDSFIQGRGPWTRIVDGITVCVSCSRPIMRKPIGCSESRHLSYYRRRLKTPYRVPWTMKVNGKIICKACKQPPRNLPNDCPEPRHVEYRKRQMYNQRCRVHAHPERRAWKRSERLHKFRMLVLEALGGKCARCGFTDTRALQIDHVNDDGCLEVNRMGTVPFYRMILRQMSEGTMTKYQVLCANCNWIKRYEKENGSNG